MWVPHCGHEAGALGEEKEGGRGCEGVRTDMGRTKSVTRYVGRTSRKMCIEFGRGCDVAVEPAKRKDNIQEFRSTAGTFIYLLWN